MENSSGYLQISTSIAAENEDSTIQKRKMTVDNMLTLDSID